MEEIGSGRLDERLTVHRCKGSSIPSSGRFHPFLQKYGFACWGWGVAHRRQQRGDNRRIAEVTVLHVFIPYIFGSTSFTCNEIGPGSANSFAAQDMYLSMLFSLIGAVGTGPTPHLGIVWHCQTKLEKLLLRLSDITIAEKEPTLRWPRYLDMAMRSSLVVQYSRLPRSRVVISTTHCILCAFFLFVWPIPTSMEMR